MEKKGFRKAGAVLVLLLGLLGVSVSAQAADQGKVLRSKQVGNTRVVEYVPQTMAAGGQYASGAVPTVKTNKAFYKEVRKNLLKGKTSFSILYKGSANPYNLGLYDNVLAQVRKLDDKSTSSDGDYLANNIYQIAWSSYTNYKGTTMTFDIIYWETASQTKAVTKKAKSALKKLKVSNMSGIARVKAVHDYVVNLVEYDRSYRDHSAYGGLVASKHSTVCQGYVGIVYKMLTEAGVTCRIVTGYASGGSHAWNIVKIGKKWYHLDVTFDDPISSYPVCRYDYFLVGDNTILQDHILDDTYDGAFKYSAKNYNWKKAIKKSGKSADKAVIDW